MNPVRLKPVKPVDRVLIIRLSAIGDIVFASGLVPALKRQWPRVKIDWLVDESYRELVTANPNLESVYDWPRTRWRGYWQSRNWGSLAAEMGQLIHRLRERHYDWILDVQGLLKSGVFARLAQGRVRLGLGSREGSQWWMDRVIDRRSGDLRIASEYLALLRALGVDPGHYPLSVVPPRACRQQALDFLQSHQINGPYAVFCPFTTRPQKHWLAPRWSELACRVWEHFGFPSVIVGAPAECSDARRIAAQCGGAAIAAAGSLALGASAALIQRAGLVVGVDTGMTHLGIAFQRPTVAVFGATRPYLDPVHDRARVLYRPRPCSPCRKKPTCGGRYDCMNDWQIKDLMAAIAGVLP